MPYPWTYKGNGKGKGFGKKGKAKGKGGKSEGKGYKGETKGKGKGEYKGRGKGYGKPLASIFYCACRICGQTGHTQAYCPTLGLGFTGECTYCQQTGHIRQYCPVENSIKEAYYNDWGSCDQEEPEKEHSEGSSVKCLSEGDAPAFGGYIGGRVASVTQTDDEVLVHNVEEQNDEKKTKQRRTYRDAAKFWCIT